MRGRHRVNRKEIQKAKYVGVLRGDKQASIKGIIETRRIYTEYSK